MFEFELLGQQSIPFTPQEPVTKQGNDRRPKTKKPTHKHRIERYVKQTNRTLPYTPSDGALQLGILTEYRVQQGVSLWDETGIKK